MRTFARRPMLSPPVRGDMKRAVDKRPEQAVRPRQCGAAQGRCVRLTLALGVPPRLRGSRRQAVQLQPAAGSIPARAGRSPFRSGIRWEVRAHPRARGAFHGRAASVLTLKGAYPRARVVLSARDGSFAGPWRIPARSGRSSTGRECCARTAAYPRACGAFLRRSGSPFHDFGVSPRGLGARSMEPLAVAGNGQYGYLDGLGEARRLVLGQLARLISSAADLQAASR